MGNQVFADHASAMRQQRLAVIPLGHDREPRVSGFNKWNSPPGLRRVEEWRERFGDANIGVIPALSGRHGAMVLDCDTMEDASKVEEACGRTPLQTITRRGRHLWYATTSAKLPGNLRQYGLEVDIKRSKGELVVAPPSIHETGHVYRLADADWSALDRLPALNLEGLQRLTSDWGTSEATPPEQAAARIVRKGERTVTLNKLLVRYAFDFAEFDALLDLAHTFNAEFVPPMAADRVVKCAAKVWRDKAEEKIEPWKGQTSMEKRSRRDLRLLCELDPRYGPDAFALWQVLQDEHAARCRRGEAFQITPKAMAAAQVMPGWKRERYEAARDLLLRAKFLWRIQSFKSNSAEGRKPALFKLRTESMGAAGGGSIYGLH